MNLTNGRHPEQIKRMKELKKNNACHFCKDGLKTHSSPIEYKNNSWFVTANDFPYQGAKHHYLIASKKHITDFSKINKKAQNDLFDAFNWLKKKLKSSGESIFVRSGDIRYTGATLDHLHFHFLVGNKQTKNPELLMVVLGYK